VHPQQAQLPDLPAAKQAAKRICTVKRPATRAQAAQSLAAAQDPDAAAGQPRRRDPALPPPSTGLWGGLWSLPELDDLEQLDDLAYQHGLRWPAARPCKA
jgi:hypothetical protein